MNLNIPDTRQSELATRLKEGQQLVAIELAHEFGVSIDTIRRDILALEAQGKAHRVRGGAVPIAAPAAPLHVRLTDGPPPDKNLIQSAIREIGDAPTLLVDGGQTILCVIEHLPKQQGRLVITPSPWVAIACQERGIAVFMLGGTLRPLGGITTGDTTTTRIAELYADIALIGACGIEADFGLSSDDHDEAMMKRAMHEAANRTIIVTDKAKIGRRARYQTLTMSDIDTVITDASSEMTKTLQASGTRVVTSQ
ncbi:DeoR/GlpR family DNA-binding transcription regulator [Cohaesibacter gelatinilyticus]|uniref:Transcriptional regulator, DeoR family n=1 Tax=Cohaesibacter gelatinilyticus TaxID=372072 RepID=A0A285PG33_9HYPH|nr:DeoR/GlpR family DNA-binding transcription regulator [Cohaesibacter gelatinilyticus]SNZ19106.1 transcriptional regulator, DeoR family [Cohaesibacter gelatinilyticus]